MQVRMKREGRENSYLHKYSILNSYGNGLELLEFLSWLQRGGMCISKKVTFPSCAVEKYSPISILHYRNFSVSRVCNRWMLRNAIIRSEMFFWHARTGNSISGGCGCKRRLRTEKCRCISFVWFQQHAKWECISAKKPVTASLENWILNVFLFLLLSSHRPLWLVKGFNSFILSFVSWSTSFPVSNYYLLLYNFLSHELLS